MKKHPLRFILLCAAAASVAVHAHAYRIELSAPTLHDTPVFLAGYYGGHVLVIDSAHLDGAGHAVFVQHDDSLTGMYTLVVPGRLEYDLLLEDVHQLRVEWRAGKDATVAGNAQATAYAQYLSWMAGGHSREQAAEHRRALIEAHPATFLAAYLSALQPAEQDAQLTVNDTAQILKVYINRRRHFFDHINLSDPQLLRTPLYHETVNYYIKQFVTQHADTLIHITYPMLQQASGSAETFFYMSDFLIDFCMRSSIENSGRLLQFLLRNRDMADAAVIKTLSSRQRNNYFPLPHSPSLQRRLDALHLTDMEQLPFSPKDIPTKYRIFYFWKNYCPRCMMGVPQLHEVLNKHKHQSAFCIAVNTAYSVQHPNNRILNDNTSCVNVSAEDLPSHDEIFLTDIYPRIIVTNTAGRIIGVFSSVASLDDFFSSL